MNLGKLIANQILQELEDSVTVLFPGGFKPPHGGHLELAQRYASLPNVKEVIILIGPENRGTITRDKSVMVWKMLATNPKIKIQKTESNSPLAAAYKYIETAKPGTYALASSSKGEDYARVGRFIQGHQPGQKYNREGISVVELPLDTKPLLYKDRTDSFNGKGVSASILRQDLQNKDFENFKTSYPEVKDEKKLKAIYSILTNTMTVTEGKLRVFDFDDTVVHTNSKVYVSKRDGRKIPLTPAEYAVYEPDEHDVFDYSDFDKDIKSAQQTPYAKLLRKMLQAPGTDRRVAILTARSDAKVVYDYLMRDAKIRIPVIALGSSDPQKKADWIEDQIKQGYDDIYFIDDSFKNIQAVQALSTKYPNVKIKTQLAKKSEALPTPAQNYLREMLMEGGAAGHLTHPYEDMDMTFDDAKNMITAALSGKLEYAQEKLDGQNLMITHKDGKVRAARNKTQLKNFGEKSLTIDQVAEMFSNRGAIKTAFVEAMRDLESAINGLDKKQKENFFQNGKRFISLEVLYPETANVVPYGAAQLRLHHFKEYDETGNITDEDVEGIYQLQKALDTMQAEQQKTYTIKTTDPAKLKQDIDLQGQLSAFTKELKGIQDVYKLKGSDPIGTYIQTWWKEYIKTNAKSYQYKLSDDLLEILSRRWAFDDKSTSVKEIKGMIDNEGFLNWVKDTDTTKLPALRKQAVNPIEMLFLKLGVRVLKNLESIVSINPNAAAKEMKANVNKAIDDIRIAGKGGNVDALTFLKRELIRLKDVGGMKAILPTEGIVFKYNNKLYKLTGAFAPINQILGYLKF